MHNSQNSLVNIEIQDFGNGQTRSESARSIELPGVQPELG